MLKNFAALTLRRNSQFFCEASEKHTIIFNRKKIEFINFFIFLHNFPRDYIPPSGCRAKPERTQGGVEKTKI